MEVREVRMMTTVALIVFVFAIAVNGLLLALDGRATFSHAGQGDLTVTYSR